MKGKRLFVRALVLALTLVMAAAATTGCTQDIPEDEIVAMVGDTPIYKWYYQAHLTKQLALYQTYYGKDLTQPAYKGELKEYKENRLNDLIGEFALRDLARKKGLYDLTAEQEAQIDQEYLDFYNQNMQGFLAEHGADDEGRRKAEQAYIDWLATSNLTPERVRATLVDDMVLAELYKELAENADITEEDLRAFYDSTLETQKSSMEEDVKWLGENKPDPILYAPEGYVETVRLTLNFTDAQMADLQLAANTVSVAKNEYQSAVAQSGEDSPAAKLKVQAYESAATKFEDVLNRCYEERTKDMQSILEELRGGADFIATMEKKSQDTHLINYYVCEMSTHVEDAYREAALQLENPGDISEAVRIESGVCIIQLVEKVPAGVQPFENVKEALRESVAATNNMNVTFNLKEEYAKKALEENIVQLYLDKL